MHPVAFLESPLQALQGPYFERLPERIRPLERQVEQRTADLLVMGRWAARFGLVFQTCYTCFIESFHPSQARLLAGKASPKSSMGSKQFWIIQHGYNDLAPWTRRWGFFREAASRVFRFLLRLLRIVVLRLFVWLPPVLQEEAILYEFDERTTK
jgi:hypothetical protein